MAIHQDLYVELTYLLLPTQLMFFHGVLAVGTQGGKVHLVDLAMDGGPGACSSSSSSSAPRDDEGADFWGGLGEEGEKGQPECLLDGRFFHFYSHCLQRPRTLTSPARAAPPPSARSDPSTGRDTNKVITEGDSSSSNSRREEEEEGVFSPT